MKIHIVSLVVLVLVGCGAEHSHTSSGKFGKPIVPVPATTYEWGVVNDSATDIDVALTYGGRKESFGVVGAGVGKHEGFVPFSIGWLIEVTWTEGDRDGDKKTCRLTTAQYAGQKDRIKSLELHCQTNGEWTVVAYDAVGLGQKTVDPDPPGPSPSAPATTNAATNVPANK